jgi:hypothetical protein
VTAHLRQEKTGRLRTPPQEHPRKVDFANGYQLTQPV